MVFEVDALRNANPAKLGRNLQLKFGKKTFSFSDRQKFIIFQLARLSGSFLDPQFRAPHVPAALSLVHIPAGIVSPVRNLASFVILVLSQTRASTPTQHTNAALKAATPPTPTMAIPWGT